MARPRYIVPVLFVVSAAFIVSVLIARAWNGPTRYDREGVILRCGSRFAELGLIEDDVSLGVLLRHGNELGQTFSRRFVASPVTQSEPLNGFGVLLRRSNDPKAVILANVVDRRAYRFTNKSRSEINWKEVAPLLVNRSGIYGSIDWQN